MKRFIRFFYERVPAYCTTKKWHGRAYYDLLRNRNVMVLYPFHWVVNFFWWANLKWCMHRGKESWIDRMVRKYKEEMG